MKHSLPFSIGRCSGLTDSLAAMFEFDQHINATVLDAMATLGDALPKKPLARMCHIIICKQLWLARMGAALPMPADIFPLWSLDTARARNTETAQAMQHALAEMDDEACRRAFEYSAMDGERFVSHRCDVFMQLLMHGSYHRGQIAMELNPLLASPLVLDYIYQARMPASAS